MYEKEIKLMVQNCNAIAKHFGITKAEVQSAIATQDYIASGCEQYIATWDFDVANMEALVKVGLASFNGIGYILTDKGVLFMPYIKGGDKCVKPILNTQT